MAECFFHTGRPAVARCKQCGRPVCSQCRIVGEDGIFCSEKCRQTFAIFAKRIKEMEERKPGGKQWSFSVRVVFLIILLAVVFFIWKRFFR